MLIHRLYSKFHCKFMQGFTLNSPLSRSCDFKRSYDPRFSIFYNQAFIASNSNFNSNYLTSYLPISSFIASRNIVSLPANVSVNWNLSFSELLRTYPLSTLKLRGLELVRQAPNFNNYLLLAQIMDAAKDWDDGLKACIEAEKYSLSIDDEREVNFMKMQVLMNTGKFQQVLDIIESFPNSLKRHPECRYLESQCHFKLGNYETAIRCALIGLKKRKKHPMLASNAAMIAANSFLQMKKPVQALKLVIDAIKISKRKNIESLLLKATLLGSLGQYQEATCFLTTYFFKVFLKRFASSELSSAYLEMAWIIQARNYLRAGKPRKAILCVDRAIALKPMNTERLACLLYMMNEIGYYSQAVEMAQRLLTIEPDCENLMIQLVFGLAGLNHIDQAVLYLENKVLIKFPNNPHTWYIYSKMLFDLKRFQDSYIACKQALKNDPNDLGALYQEASLLCFMGRFSDGLSCWKNLQKLYSNYQVYLEIAQTLVHLERNEEAIRYYEEALLHNSTRPYIWREKACVEIRLKKFDEAFKSIDQGIQLNPHEIKSWHVRKLALEGKGDYEGALKCREAISELKKVLKKRNEGVKIKIRLLADIMKFKSLPKSEKLKVLGAENMKMDILKEQETAQLGENFDTINTSHVEAIGIREGTG